MSQIDLAKAAGIGQSTISAIENGVNQPTVDIVENVCTALSISLADFFAEETDAPLGIRQLQNVAQTLNPRQLSLLSEFLQSIQEKRTEIEAVNVQNIAAHLESEYGIADEQFNKDILTVIERAKARVRDKK